MKKFLYIVLGIIVVALIALYVVLFTSFGNKIVASIIEDKIKTSTGLDANLTKFELRFSSLDIGLDIANMAQFKVEGNLSLFRLGFDLDYLLSVNKDYVKQMNLNLDKNLNFKGEVAGKASDFNASGAGELFGSNVSLNARLLDYSPLELKLNANGIKIEEILTFLAQPNYMNGVLNVNADIKAKDLKPNGNALINLYTSSINYAQIKKDFNLTLPAKSEPIAQISVDVNDQDIHAKTEVANAYLTLKLPNTHYNLSDQKLESDLSLDILNLAQLDSILQSKTKGSLNLNANAKLTGSVLDSVNAKLTGQKVSLLDLPASSLLLNAKAAQSGTKIAYEADFSSAWAKISKLQGSYDLSNSNLIADLKASVDDLSQFKSIAGQELKGQVSLDAKAELNGSEIKDLQVNADVAGGKITASSNGKALDVNINALDLTKVFVLAGQASYVNGLLNAKAHLSSLDFAKLNGNYELKSSGTFNERTLSKMLEKNFPANTKYDLDLSGTLKDSVVDFNLILKSGLANLDYFKGSFDINQIKLSSNFSLDAYDFSKLGFLADRKLSGKSKFNGNLNFANSQADATIKSDNLFQGKLNASLKNNVFNADLNGVDFSSLMLGLDLPDYYNAKANVKLDYNLLSQSGNANASLNNGKLKKVGIVNTISTLTKSDFTNDVFHTANANAKLGKNKVDLDVNLVSNRVKVDIQKGVINTANSTLDLPLTLGVDKANFKAKITGKIDSPSVNIDLGSAVKAGVDKLLQNEKIKEKGAKELNKLLDKLF
ncbi:hypothetical protein DMB92_01495 [Campylobacter sp. MIT 99-7217]|uniref:hypothetical protein n=1 Tax=Campylobacter sp. MIT 99-7217 TaxID=535091 RepID=UPI00115A5293|nr:hypothetical protein [Campylobacter sp. MIT 99-7217]TQR34660.1 hypothetical protein DMB92_01495 [Campylobacter sp. MIT 99-7217]